MDGKSRVVFSTECPKNRGTAILSVYLSFSLLRNAFTEHHSRAKDFMPKVFSKKPPKGSPRRQSHGSLNRRGRRWETMPIFICAVSRITASLRPRHLPNRGSSSTAPRGRRDCYRPARENGVTFALLDNEAWRSTGRVGADVVMRSKQIGAVGSVWGSAKKEPADEESVLLIPMGTSLQPEIYDNPIHITTRVP